jgi:hypothetical protein
MASDPEEIGRLTALVSWQRGELDRLRAQAAARGAVERATGVLMERLGCPATDAGEQLAGLAADAGVSLADIAADILGEGLADAPAPVRRRVGLADAAMAGAPDAAGLAEALLAEALSAEGAEAVAVWLLAPDGGIELAGEAGFGPREAARWRRIPPDVPSLPLRAIRQDAEIWWPAGRPPDDDSMLIGQRPGRARAVVPLRHRGSCLGALEVCWPAALSEFPASVHRQLPALAGSCAQALSVGPSGTPVPDYSSAWVFGLLDGLLHGPRERVLFARAMRDDQGNLDGFMIEWADQGYRDPAGRSAANVAGRPLLAVYPEAAAAGGLLEAAGQVLASGEPRRIGGMAMTGGDVAEVSLARLFDGVVIAWRDVGEAERLAALLEQAQWLGRTGGWEENLVTGQVNWAAPTFSLFGLVPGHPVRLADLDRHVPAEDVPAVRAFRDRLTRQMGPVTAAFRIVRADDGSVRQLRAFAQPAAAHGGTVVTVRGAYQDVSAQYHTQVAFAVAKEQLAGTEERAREEHELAVRLQQAITPQTAQPVEAAGIDVAARYRPASQHHLVGGDWYDTVLLPDKSVLLAVGDVAGHGIGAVTGMVALRNHLRGLAVTGAGPGALLTWLNSAAFHLAGAMATAICGIYEPRSRTLRWARAGHLPPLIVRDGTVSIPSPPNGVLLGADPDACYAEATVSLRLGDAVVLFTDGLIERRDQPLDNALEHLARLAARPFTDIGQFADHLLDSAPSDTGDDTCLVALSIR